VRPGRVGDADALGRVHTQVWHEAYASLMPAAFLGGLDAGQSAERWRLRLEVDEPDSVVVVANLPDGELVGFATAGLTRDDDGPTAWELYSINVLAAHHGTGVADDLLVAAVGDRPASLWVLTGNHRAQSFYSRYQFAPDGSTKVHEATGAAEIRLTRGGTGATTG